MKKILFTIFILVIFTKVKAIENIKINGDTLSPIFDINLKKYNYFTNEDKIIINVVKSNDEIIIGDGEFELYNDISKYNINSNISGDYEITVYKNYKKKDLEYGKLLDLKIKDYEINFNSDIYEYDININDESFLNIDYELLNDKSYVDVKGNGNFNDELNVIEINVDNINTYKINVHKTIKVFEPINNEIVVEEMSYTKKEIVKIVIITISCSLVFLMFYFLFIKKFNLHV